MTHADEPDDVPSLVADIRAARALTQEGLARELGVSFSTVNAWEAGRSTPQLRHLRRLQDLGREARGAQPADERLRVLCVDDSPLDLETLTTVIIDAAAVLGIDVNVVTEQDAMGALLSLGRTAPDLAVVDIVMPGLDGFELAGRIQKMQLPVGSLALVTSRRDEDIDLRAEALGLQVLDKPVSLRETGALLRDAAARAAATRSAGAMGG